MKFLVERGNRLGDRFGGEAKSARCSAFAVNTSRARRMLATAVARSFFWSAFILDTSKSRARPMRALAKPTKPASAVGCQSRQIAACPRLCSTLTGPAGDLIITAQVTPEDRHVRTARIPSARGPSLARHALAHGAVLVSPTLVRWSLSGTCSNPQDVLLEGKHDAKEDLGGERPLSTACTERA